jgi:hypothetical protein
MEILGTGDESVYSVEGDTVEKAVGDSMGVVVLYEGTKRGEITHQVCDDHASLFFFRAANSKCDVRRGNWIAGADNRGGVASQRWCYLASGIYPGFGTAAVDRVQGEPS